MAIGVKTVVSDWPRPEMVLPMDWIPLAKSRWAVRIALDTPSALMMIEPYAEPKLYPPPPSTMLRLTKTAHILLDMSRAHACPRSFHQHTGDARQLRGIHRALFLLLRRRQQIFNPVLRPAFVVPFVQFVHHPLAERHHRVIELVGQPGVIANPEDCGGAFGLHFRHAVQLPNGRFVAQERSRQAETALPS